MKAKDLKSLISRMPQEMEVDIILSADLDVDDCKKIINDRRNKASKRGIFGRKRR